MTLLGSCDTFARIMVPRESPPPYATQRRSLRYDFGVVAELTDLESGRMKVALVRALSIHGCFVKTEIPFRVGACVALKIAHAGSEFSLVGRVVVRTPDRANRGIGVEFIVTESVDRARFEGYLADLVREEKLAKFAALRKKPGMRTTAGREAEASSEKLGKPKYPWQQAVQDAFQSPPDSLPAKINVAEGAIAARLTDANEADTEEQLALKNALRSLRVLLGETRLQSAPAKETKKRA